MYERKAEPPLFEAFSGDLFIDSIQHSMANTFAPLDYAVLFSCVFLTEKEPMQRPERHYIVCP